MNLLIMLFSITLGLQSSGPLIMEDTPVQYIDMQAGFEIADLIFIKGNIVTYIYPSDCYGFAPFQADYTLNFGVNFDWLEIGFIHTCSHNVISRKLDYIPVWTGEKIYIKISGKINLLGGENAKH